MSTATITPIKAQQDGSYEFTVTQYGETTRYSTDRAGAGLWAHDGVSAGGLGMGWKQVEGYGQFSLAGRSAAARRAYVKRYFAE